MNVSSPEIQSNYDVPSYLHDYGGGNLLARMSDIALAHAISVEETSGPLEVEEEWALLVAIQNAARENITTGFDPRKDPWLAGDEGNCFTHTLRLAELLRMTGFDAGVAFANDHTFVLARSATPETGRLYMLNPDTRVLSLGELTTASPVKQILDLGIAGQIGRDGFANRVVTTINTSPLQQIAPRITDMRVSQTRMQYMTPWVADRHPAAVIMSLEEANRSLFYYSCFVRLLERHMRQPEQHVREINTVLSLLIAHNPQMETRPRVNPSINAFKGQIRIWAHQGIKPEELEGVITAYANIMPPTFSRDIFIGDVCRTAAKHTRERKPQLLKSLLVRSVNAYESAAESASERMSSGGVTVARAKKRSCLSDARRLGIRDLDMA